MPHHRRCCSTYDAILARFSLSASVSPATAAALREANALRNCILHRGGRVDTRTKREAPGLDIVEGALLRISSESYLIYQDAVAEWLLSLLGSTSTSIYFPA